MRLVVRKRQRGLPRALAQAETEAAEPGVLPRFSKPLGLGVIITPEGQLKLIELQHGFGRRGLIQLFPGSSRSYRKTYWQLRRECGKSHRLIEGVRKICSDKIATWRLFSSYQPSSFVFRRWGPKVERWLGGLTSEFVLAKPPRGSCGEGILVLRRDALRQAPGTVPLSAPMLLQEYVRSKPLWDAAGQAHVGCIRHIVILFSRDGEQMDFVHLPPYWRVAPEPFVRRADKEALTANISRGAFPLAVEPGDAGQVRQLAEQVTRELVQHILELPQITIGEAVQVAPE
jgi:hypothetical protein